MRTTLIAEDKERRALARRAVAGDVNAAERLVELLRRDGQGADGGDGPASHEFQTCYVEPTERFVVAFITSWPDDGVSSTPTRALRRTLLFLGEDDSPDNVWSVYDRATGRLYAMEQGAAGELAKLDDDWDDESGRRRRRLRVEPE